MKFLGAVFLGLLAWAGAEAETVLDGNLRDWEGISCQSRPDSRIPRAAARAEGGRLLLSFLLPEPAVLQKNNDLFLVLDADRNPATGSFLDGLGAELVWRFGDRAGEALLEGSPIPVTAYDLGLVSAPTMAAREFEIALDTESPVLYRLLSSPQAAWGLGRGGKVEISGEVSFGPEPASVRELVPTGKGEGVRLVSYNVLRDGFLRSGDRFDRILKALKPDIVAFQEIYRGDPGEMVQRLGALLGGKWEAAAHSDLLVASRYPILRSRQVMGNLAVVLNLAGTVLGGELAVINLHLPAGEKEKGRQEEADALIAFIRDSRREDPPFLKPDTALVILGDFNLVMGTAPFFTLCDGTISACEVFGEDAPPEPDGTSLTDLFPRHNAAPEVYTWWDPRGEKPYPPGRLDFILYSDSILRPVRSFVLRTENTPAEVLGELGLERSDTSASSDHLPLVADFIRVGSPESAVPSPPEGGEACPPPAGMLP